MTGEVGKTLFIFGAVVLPLLRETLLRNLLFHDVLAYVMVREVNASLKLLKKRLNFLTWVSNMCNHFLTFINIEIKEYVIVFVKLSINFQYVCSMMIGRGYQIFHFFYFPSIICEGVSGLTPPY